VSAGTSRSWPTTDPTCPSPSYSALAERVEALRAAWGADPARYEGRWDRFSESWVNPKPVQGSIPVALGSAGPVGQGHAAAWADEWCPLNTMLRGPDGRVDAAAAIDGFRQRLADAGRDPAEVPITVHAIRRPRPGDVEALAERGVARVVLFPEAMTLHGADDTRRQLDELAPLLAEHGSG
jgi:alkanesulfonate monooxygenase SsuD/methylene tetrahydromethanopterin reductase-like flavin-dependent oxidoreductase (luciferase family)